MHGDDAMGAVVAVADGDAAWVEEYEGGVEGGEARAVGDHVPVEEGLEDCFEAGVVWVCVAGVDMGGCGEVGELGRRKSTD